MCLLDCDSGRIISAAILGSTLVLPRRKAGASGAWIFCPPLAATTHFSVSVPSADLSSRAALDLRVALPKKRVSRRGVFR